MGLPDDLTNTMLPKPWPREWMGNRPKTNRREGRNHNPRASETKFRDRTGLMCKLINQRRNKNTSSKLKPRQLPAVNK